MKLNSPIKIVGAPSMINSHCQEVNPRAFCRFENVVYATRPPSAPAMVDNE
jgi:hypothetical protein